MTDGSKAFGRTVFDPAAGRARLERSADVVRSIKAAADLSAHLPPSAARAVPVAPARGVMQVGVAYDLLPGGTRRQAGVSVREVTALEAMCAQAEARAAAKGIAAVLPFTPGQIAIAKTYRDLWEWREGSGVRCSSLEAGRGGSGSGVFVDEFMDRGAQLERLQRAIGDGWALTPRRHQDRDNARRGITVRAAVDKVVLAGCDLSAVLRAFGWEPKGELRKELRAAICGALDRMQG